MTGYRRSGKTLIEMLVIITVTGMIMTIAGKTIAVVLNKERSGRDAFLANSDRTRFASDFRRDVNAAASAALSAGPDRPDAQLDLTLPAGRTIEYRLQNDELTRSEKQAEQLLSRERYHLGFAAARFEIAAGDPELVSLTAAISPRPESSSVPSRPWKIDAATGKDLRFQAEGAP